MKDVELKMLERAKELLASGEVARVVGWKKGDFCYDPSPAVFKTVEELENGFVYDYFCGANLSKYLIDVSKKEGKTAVFLKPCDTYSFNQLVKEHRIKRENVYVIAVECMAKLDIEKIKAKGVSFVTGVEVVEKDVKVSSLYGETTLYKPEIVLEKCAVCNKTHQVKDEEIILHERPVRDVNRFAEVEKLEAMTEDERFAFWKEQLSKCIRCNACRNVCPACSCIKCVFDNPNSGIAAKANDSEFEEKMFHIIRAYHVAGRCTDCGECSRVCPQNIPLHLLNRKFIKDMDGLYGEYQAGESSEGKTPLTSYTEEDKEPNDVFNGEAK
ncbi:MAG: 4Fe-4S dicluster domain-containing protein [Clostridia bacterium]|nr:4Fe-4S dicluster domain-containing protein [Clostridia bacterium]MBQ8430244.1 4Fe-4S dicluster domain-containing protein [Clostridia bacterium]